jgi:hypothetical protein
VITYRAMLDVPKHLIRRVASLLSAERRRRGTRPGTRALTCWWQAVMAVRWMRDRTNIARLGHDHQVSRATAYRYIDEAIEVLAAQAPDLHQVLDQARQAGLAYVILDGAVIATDRVAEQTTSVKGRSIDAWYSGKHHHHGGNIQFLASPSGFPLWVSDVYPGSTHDIVAARDAVLPALYPAAAQGLPTLADKGYEGAGIGIHTPVKESKDGRPLDRGNRTYNMLLVRLRCIGERAMALLTQRWRVLQYVTASPSRVGDIAKAAIVLTRIEHALTR